MVSAMMQDRKIYLCFPKNVCCEMEVSANMDFHILEIGANIKFLCLVNIVLCFSGSPFICFAFCYNGQSLIYSGKQTMCNISLHSTAPVSPEQYFKAHVSDNCYEEQSY